MTIDSSLGYGAGENDIQFLAYKLPSFLDRHFFRPAYISQPDYVTFGAWTESRMSVPVGREHWPGLSLEPADTWRH